MSDYYNQNYTKEQISEYLSKVKECISKEQFTVLTKGESRKKNADFIKDYNLTHIRQKSILLSLETDDFCYTLESTADDSTKGHILYVFAKDKKLFPFWEEEKAETVTIYIKFDYIESECAFVVTVSFHESEKQVKYCFK